MSRVQIAVTFMDDSERFFPVPEDGGWRVHTEYGVPTLVIGGRLPRVEILLANVRHYSVEGLPARRALGSIAEALAAGRCPGCGRPFAAWGVSCHTTPAGGWVCERSTEREDRRIFCCPSVMDRKGTPGDDIRCALAPGHAVSHRGYDRLGNELQWLDAPDPVEVEGVVRWAEQQARRCGAVLAVGSPVQRLAHCERRRGHTEPHQVGDLRWEDQHHTHHLACAAVFEAAHARLVCTLAPGHEGHHVDQIAADTWPVGI